MGERSSSFARTKQAAAPQDAVFDTHAEVSLDFELVRQAASQKYTRPFLILDTAIVRNKIRRFRASSAAASGPKKLAEALDMRGHVPILRSSFFLFGFSEEKEFVMFADDVCVRDIPET